MRNGSSYREARIKIIAQPLLARGVGRECRRLVAEQMPLGNHGVGAMMRRASRRSVRDLREDKIGGHSFDADRTCSVRGNLHS